MSTNALRVAALLAGALLLAAGLLLTRPGAGVEAGTVIPMLTWAAILSAGAWALRRWLAWPGVMTVAVLALLALLSFAGLGPLVATLLLALAAVGLGSRWLDAGKPDALAAAVMGLGLIAGVGAWLLPLPLFHTPVLALLLLGIVYWRRRAIAEQLHAAGTTLCASTQAVPWPAFAFAVVLAVASMPTWLPPLMFDDLVLHLQLPTQLARDGYYRFDVGSQVWSLAPMLGNVLQGLVWVLGGGEVTSPMNALWLLLAGLGVQRIAVAVGLSASLSWLTAALYVSLPLTGTLGMGLQSETPTAAVLAWLAVLVLEGPTQPQGRRLQALAVLAGFLLGLKVINAIAVASLGLLLLWRWRGKLPWRALPLALLLGFLVGGASYTYAWSLTGNPVLPLYNAVFASPWYRPENFLDDRWVRGVDWLLPWQLTFNTNEHFEGQPGAAGFALLALAGGAVGALAQPQLRPLLLAGLAVWLLPLLPIQYLRYAHPSFVLLLPALVGGLAGVSRELLLPIFGWSLVVLQLLFQPTASWILGGMAVHDLLRRGTEEVRAKFVPERLLARKAETLLRPGDRILIASRQAPFRADFGHRAFVTNWYDHELEALAYGAESVESWSRAVAHSGATHLLLRQEHASPELHAFVAQSGSTEIARAGGATLYRLPLALTPGRESRNNRQQVVEFDLARSDPVLVDAEVTLACARSGMTLAISWTSPGSPSLARYAWITCDERGRALSRVQVSAGAGAAPLVFTAQPVADADQPASIAGQGAVVRRDLSRERDLGQPLRSLLCPRWACLQEDVVLLGTLN